RQFKHPFGISPKAYHTRGHLLEAARTLRSNSDKSFKAVAYSMGFKDPKSFTRRFKQHLGVKPSDLRLHPSSGVVESNGVRPNIFPMNVHLFPPEASPSLDQYLPKKRRMVPALPEREVILDKLRHSEKYV